MNALVLSKKQNSQGKKSADDGTVGNENAEEDAGLLEKTRMWAARLCFFLAACCFAAAFLPIFFAGIPKAWMVALVAAGIFFLALGTLVKIDQRIMLIRLLLGGLALVSLAVALLVAMFTTIWQLSPEDRRQEAVRILNETWGSSRRSEPAGTTAEATPAGPRATDFLARLPRERNRRSFLSEIEAAIDRQMDRLSLSGQTMNLSLDLKTEIYGGIGRLKSLAVPDEAGLRQLIEALAALESL